MEVLRLLAFFSLFFVSESFSVEQNQRTFLIGVHERPIYREWKNNQWQGIDIELVDAIFARTGFQYEFIEMPWRRTLQEIESGSIDMALSSAKTPERAKFARFSGEVFRKGHNALFIRKQDVEKFKTVRTLSDIRSLDAKLGVVRGISYSDEFDQLKETRWFNSKLLILSDKKMLPELLLLGRIDAYIDSEADSKFLLQSKNEYSDTIVEIGKVTTNEEAQTFIMFSKKSVDEDTVLTFDQALKDIRSQGKFDAIFQDYGLQNQAN